MTLRQRLTASYILVALLALLLASMAGALLVRAGQVRAAERSLRLLTALVESGDVAPGAVPLRRTVAAGARLLLIEPDGQVVEDSERVLTGKVLPLRESVRPGAAGANAPFAVRRLRVGRDLFFYTVRPATVAGNSGLRLVIALPVATVLDSWLSLLPGVLLLSSLGVLVAGLVGAYVSKQLTRPVEELTQAANRMAQGDYESQVSVRGEVSELQTLSQSFNTMAQQVRSARQAQREFLANVSHDLRTPLTSIQGFSQALSDGTVPTDQIGHVSDIIHSEAARLTRLVQELLDLARIEAGRFVLARRELAMNQVLERCVEKFRLQAEQGGITLESALPPHPLPVYGDADRLEQVVTNLLDNALTHARAGGGHVFVGASLGGGASKGASVEAKPQAWMEIYVADDGPGISNDQKARIFERFYQSDRARGNSGMGLGLAIAREIVQAHGGDLLVRDRAPRGAEFVVRLPLSEG